MKKQSRPKNCTHTNKTVTLSNRGLMYFKLYNYIILNYLLFYVFAKLLRNYNYKVAVSHLVVC